MPIDPKTDCYAILGVPTDAEEGAIRAAFQNLSQRYRSDYLSGSRDEAERKLSDLTSAYEVLVDPLQRRRYDYHRRVYAKTSSMEQPTRNGRTVPKTASIEQPARDGRTVAAALPADTAPSLPPRSRAPLFVFVAAVVVAITAAAVLYWISDRPDTRPAATRTAPPPSNDAKLPAATAPAAESATAKSAPPAQAPRAAPQASPEAKAPAPAPSIEPKGATAPAATSEAKSATAQAATPDTKSATAAQAPVPEAKSATAQPRAGETKAGPIRSSPNESSGVPASAADSGRVVDPSRDDAKRAQKAPSKSAATRPINPAPGAAGTQACTDVTIVLGLCKPNPPVKDK